MRFIYTKTNLTGPHTPSGETDECYKWNTMVCQTGTVFSWRPGISSQVSTTSSVCLLRGCVGPAGVFSSFPSCWKPRFRSAGVKLVSCCSGQGGTWACGASWRRLEAASQPQFSLITSPKSLPRRWTPLMQQLLLAVPFFGPNQIPHLLTWLVLSCKAFIAKINSFWKQWGRKQKIGKFFLSARCIYSLLTVLKCSQQWVFACLINVS